MNAENPVQIDLFDVSATGTKDTSSRTRPGPQTSSPPTSRVPPGNPWGLELLHRLAATAARRQLVPQTITDRDLNQSVNRRSGRQPGQRCGCLRPRRAG